MKRRIIEIDQKKCNGCGACADACHEGAIIADSIYLITRTLWLNLLKSNAAIRGWLTVFRADIKAQGGLGQPVAPIIVA